MESKFQTILNSLDKDFIIWLNQQVVNEDPSSTFGLVNPDNIDGAIYSAIYDFEENHNISRSLAVLIHHIASGHPFADGNKRTSYALLLTIISRLSDKNILDLRQIIWNSGLREIILTTLAEISSDEDEEKSINTLQEVIEKVIDLSCRH
ncbi:type II toxin-antitoxin system death-on-curing family toxin [Acidianus sp. HS-5]|uniref:type II toxin-antitoxin system death-on-curing family toxin n=1 Tax=Acidianus sp. HS-5 TaxID=2886040 RepID=UPI001F00E206|nr:type II toxin-antitoxin system death-on-curing family toxin [Acidianus sp. HS-5]BDC17683.1 death-on-curing protein [Acidianus sp. HS-5]